jgi:hypothetical protein
MADMDMAITAEVNEPLSILRRPTPRSPRAERRDGADVPCVSTVKFPWGLEARILNISSSGMLFESGTRVPPGSCQRLVLCGPDIEIEVPASFVRSEVALVNGLGVKYHIAVAFAVPLELDILRPRAAEVPLPSDALRSLLAHVAAELGPGPRDIRTAVERALRRATGALDVRIWSGAPPPCRHGEAVDVTVPLPSGDELVTLRMLVGAGMQAAAMERLARAAASLAALVLEFEQ